eukprot:gene11228-3275_t
MERFKKVESKRARTVAQGKERWSRPAVPPTPTPAPTPAAPPAAAENKNNIKWALHLRL